MRLAFTLVGALALSGCTSAHRAGSTVVVTASGRIGPLHVDDSRRSDVISFAGRPDAENRGHYYTGFDALGYGCHGNIATDKPGIPKCTTVYYLDGRTGRLALLYTQSARYVEPHGVHPGTRTPVAVHRLRRRPFNGCYSGFRFDTKTGFLVMWLLGGRRLVGNHVGFLVVHSRHLNPGVLDCIDS